MPNKPFFTIDTISTFISIGWTSLNTSGHPSPHIQLLVWRQQTHFSKLYPTSSIHAGKFQPSVSLQRSAGSHTTSNIDPPATLYSYSQGTNLSRLKASFSSVGPQPTGTCPRGGKENAPWVTSCQVLPGSATLPSAS